MNREEQLFSVYWYQPSCLPPEGLKTWKDAFCYFSFTPFYQQLDTGKQCDNLATLTEDQILPFKVVESPKKNDYLILKLDRQNEKIDVCFLSFLQIINFSFQIFELFLIITIITIVFDN